jgi:hypothetical protein
MQIIEGTGHICNISRFLPFLEHGSSQVGKPITGNLNIGSVVIIRIASISITEKYVETNALVIPCSGETTEVGWICRTYDYPFIRVINVSGRFSVFLII